MILAQTKKGYGMGHWGQGKMGAHQAKKLEDDALARLPRPLRAAALRRATCRRCAFYRPGAGQPGDALPARAPRRARRLPAGAFRHGAAIAVPALASFGKWVEGTARLGDAAGKAREQSTTMVFVQLLTQLLRDASARPHIVPIVADEARTFGMQALFRAGGDLFVALGQLYEPEDRDELLYYKEAKDGQILEEGISEAGAISSWIAAATSYSTHGVPMLPFYIFYSCFGFQRIGDLIYAAADSRARGFLIGATAGRTTLVRRGPAAPGRDEPPLRRRPCRRAAPTIPASATSWS